MTGLSKRQAWILKAVESIREKAQKRGNVEGATILESLDILRDSGRITDAEHDWADTYLHEDDY